MDYYINYTTVFINLILILKPEYNLNIAKFSNFMHTDMYSQVATKVLSCLFAVSPFLSP